MADFKSLNDLLKEHDSYEGENRRLKESNQKLRDDVVKWKRTARYDDLTGLMRRGTFDRLLERLVERSKRNNIPLSYVLVDIDHFKKVNDTYGHDKGDEVLKQVAYLLNSGVRLSDLACKKYTSRLGGEEMVIILPNTNINGAKIVAERLRKSIEDYFKKTQIKVTVSAGISSYIPEVGEGTSNIPEQLYKTADKKLYEAKEGGRNRVVY